eukprot:Awhi_evm1s11397
MVVVQRVIVSRSDEEFAAEKVQPAIDSTPLYREMISIISQGTGSWKFQETYDKENFVKIGKQMREFQKLYTLWKSTEENIYDYIDQSDQKVSPDEVVEFQRYLNAYENMLFFWLHPTYNSIEQLRSTYSHERGIVTSIGNGQFYLGYSLLKTLRDTGCTLPMEVFYLGSDDLSSENRQKLESLTNVTTRNLKLPVSDGIAGWAGKPFAVLTSRFKEVIFLDSDIIFFQEPELLFDSNLYKETGALFYLDRTLFSPGKKTLDWIKELSPNRFPEKANKNGLLQKKTGHQQESGVLVIDKDQHFLSLLATCQLNLDKTREITYNRVHGDKETFWLGWTMMENDSYNWNAYRPGVLGTFNEEGSLCSSKLFHVDENKKPLFLNGGIVDNKFVKDEDREFLKASHWTIEPGNWQLLEANRACLKKESDKGKKLSSQMQNYLMISAKNYAEVNVGMKQAFENYQKDNQKKKK